MSLFPAYSSGGEIKELNEEKGYPQTQTTYNFNVADIPIPPEIDRKQQTTDLDRRKREEGNNEYLGNNGDSPKKETCSKTEAESRTKDYINKKYKKKKRKQTKNVEVVSVDQSDYYVDTTPCKFYNSYKTLGKPIVPFYIRKFRCLGLVRVHRKRKKKYRYYTHVEKAENANIRDTSREKEEERIKNKTEEFNSVLSRDPTNVDLWHQYVNFQDDVFRFEKAYHGAHSSIPTAERKLSIIDRALSHNPTSGSLVRARLVHASAALPADVVSKQLEVLLVQHIDSVDLWRGYIRTTQCSVALCSVPVVLKLYISATEKLHQRRRGAPMSVTQLSENSILDLVLDCGLFLRQAGLWEYLWVLIQAYLSLNLICPSTNHFDIKMDVSEEDVLNEEFKLLGTQMPLLVMWVRLERFREVMHWLPNTDDADPQRSVTGEDVSELVHPITSPGLAFRLVLISLSLLKVPLLPFHDCLFRYIGLDKIPWAVDCPEFLLPSLYAPTPMWQCSSGSLMKDILSLTGGPQYLHNHLGQESYLLAVCKIFSLLSEVLPKHDSTAILIWWLRFERLLIRLQKNNLCFVPTRRKKARSIVKDFLKLESNRNNLLFYREYALIELELGNTEAAIKVLKNALSAFSGTLVVGVSDYYQKSALCSLYRTLCEIMLITGNKQEALKTLITLSTGQSNSDIQEAVKKFFHVEKENEVDFSSADDANGSESFMPDFTVDWSICYSWLLVLTKSKWDGAAHLESLISSLPSMKDQTKKCTWRIEALWEGYISLLQWLCCTDNLSFSVLVDANLRALQSFPNNLNLASSLMANKCGAVNLGNNWCQLTKCLNDREAAVTLVFFAINMMYKLVKIQMESIEGHKVLNEAGPLIPDQSIVNRHTSVLERLLENSVTKYCPLVWRLKLKLEPSERVFYKAIDDCPWLRDIYLDGAQCLAGTANKIQKLLREKELRYHALPEELEVMRSGYETFQKMQTATKQCVKDM